MRSARYFTLFVGRLLPMVSLRRFCRWKRPKFDFGEVYQGDKVLHVLRLSMLAMKP